MIFYHGSFHHKKYDLSFTMWCRDIIRVGRKKFTSFCGKDILDTVYQILSQSAQVCVEV